MDKTIGIIKEMPDDEAGEKIGETDGLIVERNQKGGFDFYRDVNKLDKKKYPRLTRC